MLAKREIPRFIVIHDQFRDAFIRDIEKSYFEYALKHPELPTDHQVFGSVSSFLHKAALLEIFEDEHYFSKPTTLRTFSSPYPADEFLDEFESTNEHDFADDIMKVLNFHHLSYESCYYEKFINMPCGRVW